jgi:hypothetical protein
VDHRHHRSSKKKKGKKKGMMVGTVNFGDYTAVASATFFGGHCCCCQQFEWNFHPLEKWSQKDLRSF